MIRIIESLLDVDHYKITMSQFAFFKHREAIVKFGYLNRTSTKEIDQVLVSLIPWIKQEINHVLTLRFSFSELLHLQKKGIFQQEYLDALTYFKFPEPKISVNEGRLNIECEGKWYIVTYWETIILTIIAELYARHISFKKYCKENQVNTNDISTLYAKLMNGEEDVVSAVVAPFEEEAMKRLEEKIKSFKRIISARFFEFGTRRRYSRRLQEKVVLRLQDAFHKTQLGGLSQFSGTSNEYLAMNHNIDSGGTMAHETFSIIAGLSNDSDESIANSQYEFLREWNKFYGDKLSVALTDTFGSEYFFDNCPEDIAKSYSFREDSSTNLFEYTSMVLDLYRKFNIDSSEKIIVHSNGLDINKINEIHRYEIERINKIYGIGTYLSCDVGFSFPHISSVMKAVMVNGIHLVKLSDNLAKAIGEKEQQERYKRIFAYTNQKSVAQVY